MNWLKVITLTTALTATATMAEVAVIVHPSNAATVDQAEITRLFTGRGTTFNNGSKATPLNLAESAAARGEFDSKVLSKSSSQMKAYWSKLVFTGKGTPPKELASEEEMLKLVAGNPSLIGFVDASKVDASVKVAFKF